MYRLDAVVQETTLFREPRALGCRRLECCEGTTKRPRGSPTCVVSETTWLRLLHAHMHAIGCGILNG